MNRTVSKLLRLLPDKQYVQLQYLSNHHRLPNLKNPQTLNEKVMWLKLYDHKPVYTTMVDKYAAKAYISERVGSEYIVPTLGVWNNVEDINFESLPQQFVLKWNHDSGGVVICKDKSTFDIESAKIRLDKRKNNNGFWYGREWPYKNVPHKILAEAYLGENLQDYRIYCYNGEPKYIYSYTNESFADGSKPEPAYCDIYDCDWKPMAFRQKSPPRGNVERPSGLNVMLDIARKLSVDSPFLRVDFYQIGEQVYVGELTFFPGSGLTKFIPAEWDGILGSWLELPKDKIV